MVARKAPSANKGRVDDAQRKPENRAAQSRGFTLLEVLVSMAILATGMVILLEGHAASVRISDSSRRMSIATALAQDVMTDFEMRGFPSLGSESGDFTETYPGFYPEYRWEIEVMESNFWQYVREVYVKVLWNDGADVRSVELANFVAAMNEDEQIIADSESTGAANVDNLYGAYEDAASKTKGAGMGDL